MTEAIAIAEIINALGAIFQIADYLTPDEVVNNTTIFHFSSNDWIGGTQYTYVDEYNNSHLVDATLNLSQSNIYAGRNILISPYLNIIFQTGNGSVPNRYPTTSMLFRSELEKVTLNNVYRNFAWNTKWVSANGAEVTFAGDTSIVAEVGVNSRYTVYSDGRITRTGEPFTLMNTTLTTFAEMKTSGAPYIPAGDYTFDQIRGELINQYNINFNLNIPQDETDIPTFDDLNEEPTEEPTEWLPGFEFNYDEVISPSELEDILNQETYDWNEVDTELIELPELPTIPAYETDQNEADVLTAIPVIATVSMNMLGSLGLLSVFTSIAVIKMILKVLRNKKGGDD